MAGLGGFVELAPWSLGMWRPVSRALSSLGLLGHLTSSFPKLHLGARRCARPSVNPLGNFSWGNFP